MQTLVLINSNKLSKSDFARNFSSIFEGILLKYKDFFGKSVG